MQYQVNCNDVTAVVSADSEAEAWAKFADGHPDCQKHPKSNDCKITEHKPVDSTEAVPKKK